MVGDTSPEGSGRVRVPVGSLLTATTALLCSQNGPVHIRGVRLARATGLRFVDWGTHPFPPMEYDTMHYGGLRSGFSKSPIRPTCGDRLHAAELDISLRTYAPIAVTHGFYVDYRGGSLFVPFEIYFCAADECPDWLNLGPMP
jgi:hypothetical protein